MTDHALYRFFDGDGQLLYIGITHDAHRRFQQHAGRKPWWSDVRQILLEVYPDRESVLAAETRAIIDEKPLHNVVHNRNRPAQKSTPTRVEVADVPQSDEDRIAAMTPEEFSAYFEAKFPRVKGPLPESKPQPCWVCGEPRGRGSKVIRLKSGAMKVAHRECRDTWIAANPEAVRLVDTERAFRDERRDAILRGEIM